MVRRVVGVAVGLVVIGALGLALGDGNETVASYPSTQALAQDIHAHGIGCSRLYPIRAPGWAGPVPSWADRVPGWANHNAVNCEVGSAAVTLHTWKGVSSPTYLGEPSRHFPWVVGPNWLVATTNRLTAVQVAKAIGGNLIPF